MNPDVLIVGAGPVGLFTAIEMKLKNPALNIKMIDRYNEYKRHHILRLEKSSLENTEAYKKYSKVQYLDGFVPTSQIETTLSTIANELGIEIERGTTVTDPKELLTQYPTAHTIIGADGANSGVRKTFFDDKKIVDDNLQYIVEIKYKARGKTSNLRRATYVLGLGRVNHLIYENVGKEKDGFTPVSLFLFVDKKTYDEVRKTPNAKLTDLRPTSDSMVNLLNSIRPWLALRKDVLTEKISPEGEKINGVALNIYQAETFAKEYEGKNIYLAGDAAAGVPYFRALNAGLISAKVLADEISSGTPNLDELNKKLSRLAQHEIKTAETKNKKVTVGRKGAYVFRNASTITAAAILAENEHRAMQDAYINRPNLLQRNPRVIFGSAIFIIVTAIMLASLFPFVAAPALVLAGMATATAAAVVGIVIGALKIKDTLNKPIAVPLSEFSWETTSEESELSSIVSPGSRGNAAKTGEEPPVHHASPLMKPQAPMAAPDPETKHQKNM